MSRAQTILGPILNPRADGTVEFTPDGAIASDESGIITYVGPVEGLPPSLVASRKSDGVIAPPFLDAHIHIPQHPIRGQFMEGVGANPPGGRLIAGLDRNVFPAEMRCANERFAREVVDGFRADTLANGVVGGSGYMTTHPQAAAHRVIEIECEPVPPMAGADDVVLMLLGRPDPRPLRGALDELERFGLNDGPALALLENDVRATADRFESRILRVTMGGDVVYNRSTPPGRVIVVLVVVASHA